MSEVKETLWTAIHAVMVEVKNIEKGLTVGEGKMSYKGVSDKDVKVKIGQAMEKHNLIILPIKVEPNLKIERWEEDSNYGKKTKQTVFTEVLTTYKIVHTLTGETVEIQGYGHGVDSQDKSAGKATTYALKYALLYLFMVPTGDIDDADKTHSQSLPTPVAPAPVAPSAPKVLDWEQEIIDQIKDFTKKSELKYFMGTLSEMQKSDAVRNFANSHNKTLNQ